MRVVALATETLSGIPSIVYGLFGLLFFVYYLQWGLSLLAGVCTMAIMTFPIIMRATQEALAAVPDLYRAGSIAAVPVSVFSSTRTLAVHMYLLASEGLHIDATYATAVLLLAFVLLINLATSAVAKRISKGGMTDE